MRQKVLDSSLTRWDIPVMYRLGKKGIGKWVLRAIMTGREHLDETAGKNKPEYEPRSEKIIKQSAPESFLCLFHDFMPFFALYVN